MRRHAKSLLIVAALPPAVASFVALVARWDHPAVVTALAVCAIGSMLIAVPPVSRATRTAGPGLLVFHLGMVFWFYLPAVVVSFTDDQWNRSAAAITSTNRHAVMSFSAIAFFYLAFVLAYQWAPSRRTRSMVLRRIGEGLHVPPPMALTLAVTAAVAAIAFYVYESGSIATAISYVLGGRGLEKPWSSNANLGTDVTPYHYVAQGLLVLSAMTCLTLVLLKKLRGPVRVGTAAFGTGVLLWVALDSGTRSTVLMAVIPPLLLFFTRQERPGRGALRRYVVLATVAVVIIFLADFQRTFRISGFDEGSSVKLAVEDNDFFTFTTYAMAISELEPPTNESILTSLAAGPVPRFLWSNKPEPETVYLFSRYVWGRDVRVTGGNTLPSVVGQKFLSHRWRGPLQVGLALGLLLALGDAAYRRARGTSKLVYAVFLAYVFVSFRVMSFGFFTVFVLTVAAVVVLRQLSEVRVRARAGPAGPQRVGRQPT